MAEEMNLDGDEVFGSLYQDESIFRAHLWTLQKCINDRTNYHHWARRLRFVAPVEGNETAHTVITRSNDLKEEEDTVEDTPGTPEASIEDCQCTAWPSFKGREGEKTLQITPAACFHDCTHYVAVSWCWKTTGSSFDHQIVGEVNRPSKTPAIIMSRAIAFAANKNQRFIWIDKECIDQDNRNDKEAGIQSMDLVYQRSAWPVGLLNSYFDKQSHLDIWSCLVQEEDIAMESMGDLLEVLRILAEDKWFSRAWILQESVSGGVHMTLLARHSGGLAKPIHLGTIEGEIEITIENFQHCLIWADECVDNAVGDLDEGIANEIKKLTSTIWDFNPTQSYDIGAGREAVEETLAAIDEVHNEPDFRQTCNAAQALSYLRMRQNSRIPDRIAIMANLCNYSIRLDTNDIVQRIRDGLGCGFSICAFALALFNGDLSLTLPLGSECSAKSKHISYCWGPRNDSRLQQLDYCEEDDVIVRMQPPRLLRDGGLCVTGWLWEMSADDQVKLGMTPALESASLAVALCSLLKDVAGQGFNDLAHILWDHCNMAFFGTIDELLDQPTPPRVPQCISEALDDEMIDLLFGEEGAGEEDDGPSPFLGTWSHSDTEWIWQPALISGTMQAARLSDIHFTSGRDVNESVDNAGYDRSETTCMSTIKPSAFFGPQDLVWTSQTSVDKPSTLYIFTPATVLDTEMARSGRRGDPLSWVLEQPRSPEGFDVETNKVHLILRGLQTCRGYWRIPLGAEPRTFVLF